MINSQRGGLEYDAKYAYDSMSKKELTYKADIEKSVLNSDLNNFCMIRCLFNAS